MLFGCYGRPWLFSLNQAMTRGKRSDKRKRRDNSNPKRTIAGSPLSRPPPSYSKANLGITHTESLFAGYSIENAPWRDRSDWIFLWNWSSLHALISCFFNNFNIFCSNQETATVLRFSILLRNKIIYLHWNVPPEWTKRGHFADDLKPLHSNGWYIVQWLISQSDYSICISILLEFY